MLQGAINGKLKTENGKRKTMAKTIEEILNDFSEWQKANDKERCVLLIAGYEEDNDLSSITGLKQEIVGNIATKLVQERDVTEIISQAIRIAFEYANENKDN